MVIIFCLQEPTFCHFDKGEIPFKLILRDMNSFFLISGKERDPYEMTKRKEQNIKQTKEEFFISQ